MKQRVGGLEIDAVAPPRAEALDDRVRVGAEEVPDLGELRLEGGGAEVAASAPSPTDRVPPAAPAAAALSKSVENCCRWPDDPDDAIFAGSSAQARRALPHSVP